MPSVSTRVAVSDLPAAVRRLVIQETAGNLVVSGNLHLETKLTRPDESDRTIKLWRRARKHSTCLGFTPDHSSPAPIVSFVVGLTSRDIERCSVEFSSYRYKRFQSKGDRRIVRRDPFRSLPAATAWTSHPRLVTHNQIAVMEEIYNLRFSFCQISLKTECF